MNNITNTTVRCAAIQSGLAHLRKENSYIVIVAKKIEISFLKAGEKLNWLLRLICFTSTYCFSWRYLHFERYARCHKYAYQSIHLLFQRVLKGICNTVYNFVIKKNTYVIYFTCIQFKVFTEYISNGIWTKVLNKIYNNEKKGLLYCFSKMFFMNINMCFQIFNSNWESSFRFNWGQKCSSLPIYFWYATHNTWSRSSLKCPKILVWVKNYPF